MSVRASVEVPMVLGPKQVQERMQRGHVRLLDATWFMPNVERNARQEFQRGPRIPGASFWDVDRIATHREDLDEDQRSLNPLGLSHMMPTPEKFARAASLHGIDPSTHVIVYDTHGVFSSPRTAFTFYAFGHRAVSILDGGLPGWRAAGLQLEDGQPQTVEARDYPISELRPGLIRSYDEMIANARMGPRGQTVLDARPAGRYAGTAPEPRPGLSSGHIPHSQSLPATILLDTHTDPTNEASKFTTVKSQTDLWRSISDALPNGADDLDKLRQASSAAEPAATNTCGSGMTAAILWLGLYQLGVQSSIYDESWTGYAQRKESVIDKDL
jgi:thiosulfate/3-mercaptopyruvate sulfurtransferase